MQTWPQPVKLSQVGPMFRYDRPQAGRYRQFWQFDIEAIGDPGPAIDAEIIELGIRFYRDAGLAEVEVLLNSIGDPACRPAYLAVLTDYYRGHRDALPKTEQDRLERNVLRLLDSKDPAMAAINAAAPKVTDHLCGPCAEHFAAVRAHLDALDVPYRLEPALVRGLDYYTRTAFEFYLPGRDGQQQALGGGGRYDGLVELLGGRPTPGHRVRRRPGPGGPGPRRARPGRTGRRRIGRRRRRRGPGRHRRSAAHRHGPSRRRDRGSGRARPSASSASSSSRRRRERAHFAIIVGDELAGRRGPAARPAGRHAEGRAARRARPRRSRGPHGAHKHGVRED